MATPSMAAMVAFKANMNAASEVPPNASKGTGEVTAAYNTDTKMLTGRAPIRTCRVPATAAHFPRSS